MSKAYVVLEDSPAAKMLMSNRIKGFRPGGVVLMSEDELESWRKDVETIEVPDHDQKRRRQPELKLPSDVPASVIKAASYLSSWIDENDIKDWMINGLTSVKP